MKSIREYNKLDRITAIALALLILLPGFNFYANNILMVILGLGSISLFLYLIMIIICLYATFLSLRSGRISESVKVISVLTILMTLISYAFYENEIGHILINQDMNPIYSQALYLILFCIPGFIIANCCNTWDLVLKIMSFISPVVIILAFIAFFLMGFATWGDDTMNYMTLSYFLLSAACVSLYYTFTKFNFIHLTSALLSLFIISAAGCRGALVSYFVFIIIHIYRQLKIHPNSKQIKILKYIVVLGGLLIFLGGLSDIEFISAWFEELGISSRAITMINDSSFFEDNARDNIRMAIWKGIEGNPFGYGLFGDRYLTALYYNEGVEYAHNLFFEIWAEFGLFFGSFMLVYLFRKILKLYFLKIDTSILAMLTILIPYGISRLMFSGTYLNDIEFFIIVGIIFKKNKIQICHG